MMNRKMLFVINTITTRDIPSPTMAWYIDTFANLETPYIVNAFTIAITIKGINDMKA
jgi:hypothetical protein